MTSRNELIRAIDEQLAEERAALIAFVDKVRPASSCNCPSAPGQQCQLTAEECAQRFDGQSATK